MYIYYLKYSCKLPLSRTRDARRFLKPPTTSSYQATLDALLEATAQLFHSQKCCNNGSRLEFVERVQFARKVNREKFYPENFQQSCLKRLTFTNL